MHPADCRSTWSSSAALRGPRPATNCSVWPWMCGLSAARFTSTPTWLTTSMKARCRTRRRSPGSSMSCNGCSGSPSRSAAGPAHSPASSRRGSWRRRARETAMRRAVGYLGSSCSPRSDMANRCPTLWSAKSTSTAWGSWFWAREAVSRSSSCFLSTRHRMSRTPSTTMSGCVLSTKARSFSCSAGCMVCFMLAPTRRCIDR
mmetsp:Transcript_25811/g.68095  ORF Transcript_25811/g.68095 Transcript_25811/m.68095 type:complete len:202 (+) Transcript_25811:1679-2284(+)